MHPQSSLFARNPPAKCILFCEAVHTTVDAATSRRSRRLAFELARASSRRRRRSEASRAPRRRPRSGEARAPRGVREPARGGARGASGGGRRQDERRGKAPKAPLVLLQLPNAASPSQPSAAPRAASRGAACAERVAATRMAAAADVFTAIFPPRRVSGARLRAPRRRASTTSPTMTPRQRWSTWSDCARTSMVR